MMVLLASGPADHTIMTASSIMHAVRAASGGNTWPGVRAIDGTGWKVSYGLHGSYNENVEMAAGYFANKARYGLFDNADGYNVHGRWRQDSSGAVHFLNSSEANRVARTESYLSRYGYLFQNDSTRCTLLNPVAISGTQYYRVEVQPLGGRAATLWIRQSNFLVEQVTMQLSERPKRFVLAITAALGGWYCLIRKI